MKKTRVLVVEDSAVVRTLLIHIIESDPRLQLAAAVATAEEALEMLERVKPDVISLDIRLPGMNGLDATLQIMATHPTPIVVVAANVEHDELNIAMNALRAGALTVVEKPVGTTHEDYGRLAQHLRTQLAIMSEVKVVRQGIRRRLSFGSAMPEAAPPRVERPGSIDIVGIAASTGGPNALSRVLGELPKSFPLPVLLVQHMTPSFVEGFVGWLDGLSALKVKIARHTEEPQPGTVYVPPPDRHLELRNGRLWISSAAPVSSQRPSGTVLFRSLAQEKGPQALGVVLTGMGSDGADGLLEMRRAGAYTIAEDQSTAVVYGMPGVAAQIGAVREQLPLAAIAPRLCQLAGLGVREAG